MLFGQLWQLMEARLSAWRQRWWPLDPVSAVRAKADRLAGDIEERKAALAELKVQLQELRHDAETAQKEATQLTASVAECVKAGYESQAWPLALDLEELNHKLASVQREIHRQEQICWSYEFRLRQSQRELDEIREYIRRL